MHARLAFAPLALFGLIACGDSGGGGGAGGTTAAQTANANATSGATMSTSASGTANTSASSGTGGQTGSPLFVAVGYGGRRISSPDGITWSNDVIVDPNGGDDNNLFRGVGFANGRFIAVGGSSEGQIATSPDGANWTFHTPGTSWLADVVPIGTILVTAGGNGLRQRSLDSGETWVDAGPYYSGHFRAIASGNGIAVAVGHTYGNSTVGLSSTTTDGKTWTAEKTGGTAYHSVAFGAGVFVAAGDDRCSTSTDGSSWTDCNGVTGVGFDRVVFLNGEFLIGNPSGYFRSSDGASFTHLDAQRHGVSAYGQGVYVAVDWPDHISTSPDLINWTLRNGDTGPAFVEVVLGYVAP